MSELHIYNSQSGEKELFEPLVDNQVRMYVCGPTVYNRVHIGNARPAVVFDTLFRVLQREFADVIYVRNITDVDDKIIKAAAEQNESIGELTERFTQAYREDMAGLHNLEPSIAPKATEHIEDMIAMAQTLIEKGHAYEAEGHVFALPSTVCGRTWCKTRSEPTRRTLQTAI